MLNALEWLVGGYDNDCRHLKAEIGIKQVQLRDHESRIGRQFDHAEYQCQLTDLRDQLKLGPSEKPPEGGTPVTELAERIRALRAANAVEAAPERTGTRKAARAERPVTERIRAKRSETTPEPQEPAPVTPEPLPEPAKPAAMPAVQARPDDHWRRAGAVRKGDGRQLTLF